MSFQLHPQLEADCYALGDLPLSRLLLLNDARFPWCVLVPRIDGAREIHRLTDSQQAQLYPEINAVSRALEDLFSPDKLNVAAIGNLVPQLHVHVIARSVHDAAWPNPVWGFAGREVYAADAVEKRRQQLAARLGDLLVDQDQPPGPTTG